VLTGFLFCAHRWNTLEMALSGDAWIDWRRRAQALIPRDAAAEEFSVSRLFAATYPDAVSLAEVIGALRWRRLAAGGPDQQRAFAAEIGRRLGLPDYYPTVINDPVAHWIEQDCWQPPSLPNTDYRSLKTFGGSTYLKPARDSEEKRGTAAYWYAKHRRGGDGMLHHRTLNPVIIRDWSAKMQLFAGAIQLTASTRFETRRIPNVKDLTRLSTTEYLRPQPASSAYLDTAIEPVSWARRVGPRPETGARPRLPRERPAYRYHLGERARSR
jgi:hypothetical protein